MNNAVCILVFELLIVAEIDLILCDDDFLIALILIEPLFGQNVGVILSVDIENFFDTFGFIGISSVLN